MSILPDAAADRDEPNADPDVGEQHQRGLHRIRNGEEGVLALWQPANKKNSARESDDLPNYLYHRITTDAAGVVERSAYDRDRTFVQNGCGDRDEEAHGQIMCSREQ